MAGWNRDVTGAEAQDWLQAKQEGMPAVCVYVCVGGVGVEMGAACLPDGWDAAGPQARYPTQAAQRRR